MDVSSTVMSAEEVKRAVVRLAHEVIERNHASGRTIGDVVVVGMQRGGVWLAEAMVAEMVKIDPAAPRYHGTVDVSMYRDDIGRRAVVPAATRIPGDIEEKVVVLVDDVLYTGRTVRAALDALVDQGRPRAVQLAVLVDRGHRELPIRPDYVGKNIPTHLTDDVDASPEGVVVRRSNEGSGM